MHMVADIEVDKVANNMADMVADIVADNKKIPTWSWTWWPT